MTDARNGAARRDIALECVFFAECRGMKPRDARPRGQYCITTHG